MSKTVTKPKKIEPIEAAKKPDSMGEIHRRIDSARDVLVGKVPDPKSQVEQITLALIYKFMGDMDDEAVAIGGKPTFFSDKNADLAWKKLFDPRLGGADMLKLYEKAIENFSLNEKFPELFRNIFKNAYLPYRDPETLKLFLKTINGFQYDHSERLGDAFEYLLSVLGSQGDAGQFRTPRHIIDFIVKVVDPGKDDKILDPACGTAGFLISAFKHVINPHTFEHASKSGDVRKVLRLTTQERAQLMHNIRGYDISPDMVRLSLVNLYLHGFKAPEILEYDTLTSDERWNEYYDVILANPPFMSPKGGIKPHKRFSVQSNRSEVLFVDYIAEHLTPRGRAGIIVPEGIIFQSGNAYKELRKLLVDKFLWAVVSLPAGVFNPYSGVKTSILFLDRARAEKSDSILFVKVQADGFDLGAQRRANGKDDLPKALKILHDISALSVTSVVKEKRATTTEDTEGTEVQPKAIDELGLLVPKEKIAASGDYNLSMDRYQPSKQQHSGKWPMVKLGDVCEINPKKSELKDTNGNLDVSFVPMSDISETSDSFTPKGTKKLSEVIKGYTYFRDNDVLLAKVTPCFENGKAGIARNLTNGLGFGSSEFVVIRPTEQILPELIYQYITLPAFKEKGTAQMTGTGGLQRVPTSYIENYEIPLPPLEVQREIVAEIESYRRVLDGAKQVVESYKPNVEFFLRKYAPSPPAPLPEGEGSWPMVKLGKVCEVRLGKMLDAVKNTGIETQYVRNADVQWFNINIENLKSTKLTESEIQKLTLKDGDILVCEGGQPGRAAIWEYGSATEIVFQKALHRLRFDESVEPKFFLYYLYFAVESGLLNDLISGQTIKHLTGEKFDLFQFPLPPLAVQQAIVAEIEQERALVDKNRELAQLMQAKIKAVVERVWSA